ncbi:hypothetical protein ANN_27004 [Periplaneta americana]|uniref:KIF-binding protein n=1 Tax=Periplaneta americana TaxID=6978 RepID=A0ABQ8RXC9_PERAM|nr:hypothetical protein ANN_27004 [Periplaneta americana]
MWRPWEGDDEVESNVNACVPSTSRSKTITGSKCMGTLNKLSQKIICNMDAYVKSNKLGKGLITEIAKAVGLNRQAISRVVERGPKTSKKCKNKKQKFEKADNFTCDLIRRTVYDFFKNGQSPTVSEILIELRNKCEFSYKETTLRDLLKKLGFRFQILNKRRVIMESSRIVTWRYKYLKTLRSKRSAGHKIIFLDETWYNTHDVPKKSLKKMRQHRFRTVCNRQTSHRCLIDLRTRSQTPGVLRMSSEHATIRFRRDSKSGTGDKPMILNGPTSRNREGSDQVSVEAKQLGHLYLSIDQETFEPSTGEPRERFRHRSADVARCWAKYGLMLLSNSKERLMSEVHENDDSENLSVQEVGDLGNLCFSSLELSSYEDQITDKYILIYDDARKVFLDAQKWLTRAKKYYTLDGHASDYVQIVQDLSQLYKYLAFFEEDEESTNSMPNKLSEDLIRPVLIAYFRVGRLYSKIVTPDKAVQLQHLSQSLDSYKFLVDYCKNDKEAKKHVSVELVVCEEMVKLLPLKLERLQRELGELEEQ